MKEIWKDVVGYENKYMVSNLGKIYSKRIKRNMKTRISHTGYLILSLNDGTKDRTCLVHRLVAEAFIPNPLKLPCVNHKDESRTNNNVENLEWCTYSYNINYGARNEKVSNKSRKVQQISKDGTIIATYVSANHAAKELGYDHSVIYKCCRGERKTSYGFIWRYI